MKNQIDKTSWTRKEHFELFRNLDEPYFGVCINIECGEALFRCKTDGFSFYLYCIHNVLLATDMTAEFRLRIEGEQVYLYDHIHAGTTVPRANGTFGFARLPFKRNLNEFLISANDAIAEVKSRSDLIRPTGDDLIRFSSIPWLAFTSLSHAHNTGNKESCPRITFGKITSSGNTSQIPMSVHVHHGLVDGIHLANFLDRFQQLMDGHSVQSAQIHQ
ncbi:MAG: chloramphenicol acetyltransferase [Pedobacter sp.]|nr:MAG: chloramphenicol acetyltransferase [Pedobacter sp.]